jgi:hypothetical protein
MECQGERWRDGVIIDNGGEWFSKVGPPPPGFIAGHFNEMRTLAISQRVD